MPITKEMVRNAQRAAERSRAADRAVLAKNRQWWREFFAKRRAANAKRDPRIQQQIDRLLG